MEVSTRNIALYALALALLVSLMIAAPAIAKVVNCEKTICKGTQQKDTITGNGLSQTLTGALKRDLITDTASGDNDVLKGGKGNDSINAQENKYSNSDKDVVDGGPGYDQCFVDIDPKHVSDDVLNCEEVNGVKV